MLRKMEHDAWVFFPNTGICPRGCCPPEEADRKDARGATATRRGAGSWWKGSVGGVSRMAGLHPVDLSLCVLVGVISVGWFEFYKLWRKIRQQMYRDAS